MGAHLAWAQMSGRNLRGAYGSGADDGPQLTVCRRRRTVSYVQACDMEIHARLLGLYKVNLNATILQLKYLFLFIQFLYFFVRITIRVWGDKNSWS